MTKANAEEWAKALKIEPPRLESKRQKHSRRVPLRSKVTADFETYKWLSFRRVAFYSLLEAESSEAAKGGGDAPRGVAFNR